MGIGTALDGTGSEHLDPSLVCGALHEGLAFAESCEG